MAYPEPSPPAQTDGRGQALSIADLYGEINSALASAFPRSRALWVRGEIQQISDRGAGRGHCYIDLVDPDTAGAPRAPVLKVKCWQTTWGPLRAVLAKDGITLQPGMVVVLRGRLDFYAPKAEIGFVLDELDVTALIGRLAAERAALLRALRAEGLFETNKALQVAPVPLRIGLVASPGTEGCRDFLGQLLSSGFSFHVTLVPAIVQGADAPASIAAALGQLDRIGPHGLDLAVLVRGGGSKADLAAFDAELVARAVALASLPVWCGIGHTGDESVADLVANRSFITPTECGQELAARVSSWWSSHVDVLATQVLTAATTVIAEARRVQGVRRSRLAAMARHLVTGQHHLLSQKRASVRRCAPRAGEAARVRLETARARLAPLAFGQLGAAEVRVQSWRRLLSAYDVERQLGRGYSLTYDHRGALVRSVAALTPGATIVTRLVDGEARSVVHGVRGPDGVDGVEAAERSEVAEGAEGAEGNGGAEVAEVAEGAEGMRQA